MKNLQMTKAEKAWVGYDIANSAYTMLAVSLVPIWFKSLAIGEGVGMLTSDEATGVYSLVISIITVIVALIGPIIGAVSDYKDRKKPLFAIITGLGALFTILNGFASSWMVFLVLFLINHVFYNASLSLYDSMLNDVTTPERVDMISTYGFAWGYIGSLIPFFIALGAYVLGPDMLGMIGERASMVIGFSITAIWWFGFTIPLIKNYSQTYYVDKGESGVVQTFKKLGNTLLNISRDKKIFYFLIAFFMYIDGVGTIINNAINIGTDLNLNTVGQVIFLIATQVVAFLGAMVFARLSKKFDTVKLIMVCIFGYFLVALYALTLKTLLDFGILAFGVGCFQGSIQALSRSYFSQIIPKNNAGEYFGIYDIFAKGASFLGSAVIAFVKFMGYSINIAVASLGIFFVLGFIFLTIADKSPSLQEN